jgi:hypothetical protein
VLQREVKLALFLEARAAVALTQDLEGRPILGELLRDTALGRDDGLRDFGLCRWSANFGRLVVVYFRIGKNFPFKFGLCTALCLEKSFAWRRPASIDCCLPAWPTHRGRKGNRMEQARHDARG